MKFQNDGFSLVEQLIVIALIVAVLGFGAVRMMGTYQENSFDHAAKDITLALRFLQMKSIEDGRIYELSIRPDKKGVLVKRQIKGERELKPFKVSWIQALKVGQALRLAIEPDQNLYFYPDGSTSKNSLSIAKESGEKVILTLKNRIGSVDIKKSL